MRRKKVLLVDDSATALMMEQMILKNRSDIELILAREGRRRWKRRWLNCPT